MTGILGVVIALIVGILVFALVVAATVLFLRHHGQKEKKIVVKQSFGRHSTREGVGIDIPKDMESVSESQREQGKGRIYLFSLAIAAIIGTLMVKLWSLQLLSGDRYTQEAEQLMHRDVPTPAVRGRILDRNGKELVGNRASLSVIAPRKVADDRNLVYRLSLVLGIPKGILRLKLLDEMVAAQSDRVLATEVPLRAAAYIKAHPQLFVGVTIDQKVIRHYPHGSLAAHLLGYTAPITEEELKAPTNSGYENGDLVGRGGAEEAFEDDLVGVKGKRTYQVDAGGNPVALVDEVPSANGHDVSLTIDLDLQKATDRILPAVIASAVSIGRTHCNAGALVCIDIEDGGILACSSWPTYDPSSFVNGISQDLWTSLTNKASDYPMTNRAISGLYPAASTFKAFVSMAGMENGIIKDDTTSYCTGVWTGFSKDWPQKCWLKPPGHGTLGFEEAINHSCDPFFYDVGANFFRIWANQAADAKQDTFQEYLRTWGFGSKTGLDIPGESTGRVPDAAWKRNFYRETPEQSLWQGGDMTNMSIGQGDILVTPLQICNGYAGIARGGRMLKTHLYRQTLDDTGGVIKEYQVQESDVQPHVTKKHLARLHDGLERVANRLAEDFTKLPVQVACKTGTGEVPPKETCSWLAAFAPAGKPKYCVACCVEQAGTGDSVALPAVQHTLAAIYGVDLGPVRAGPAIHGD
ncbi:MAG: penicillin-binding protein 2 [Actinomycetia bacterium]|nr:penicillin-binding protein 2 [Actinomycetes bacterium]